MREEAESSHCFTSGKKNCDLKGVEVSEEQAAMRLESETNSEVRLSASKRALKIKPIWHFYERGRRCLNRQCLQNGMALYPHD